MQPCRNQVISLGFAPTAGMPATWSGTFILFPSGAMCAVQLPRSAAIRPRCERHARRPFWIPDGGSVGGERGAGISREGVMSLGGASGSGPTCELGSIECSVLRQQRCSDSGRRFPKAMGRCGLQR